MPDLNGPYFERIAGRSPSKVGFSRRGGGRGVMQIGIGDMGGGETPITAGTQVHDAIKEIMGYTVPHPDGIRLQRTLPRSFPLCPWLLADSIGEITGEGRMTQVATDPSLEASSFDNAAFYPTQEFSLEFKPVMYNVLSDDAIPTGTLTWTHDDGTTTTTPSYAEEWLRYTDIEWMPAAEYVVAQAGQFLFDVDSTSAPHGFPAGNGQIRMIMQKTAIKVTLYEVPYEYVDSVNSAGTRIASYIQQGLGHINQFKWHGFNPGTLLFQSVQITRYPQLVPEYAYGNESTAFTAKKLCDIAFLFLYTDPPLGLDKAGNAATSTPANANIIAAGHNLVPYARTGSYYMVKTNVPGFVNMNGWGVYPSFPFALLFSNPGV